MLANPSILTGLNMMLVLLVSQPTLFLATDVDQVDMESDTSGMGDVYDIEEIGDPNLTNPQRGQNYGPPLNPNTPPNRSSGSSPTTDPNTKESFSEQTIGALLELGIIVGVIFMVGGLFMAMVGMEILCDKATDQYRDLFKKPKVVPDIERLHPAELVGTFSRYK